MEFRKLLGEFAVIVVGVLTALAGESLLSSARDAAEIDIYRDLLVQDVRSDVEDLAEVKFYFGRILDSGRVIGDWLRTGQTDLSPTELLVHAANASARHPVAPSRATWDDLSTTGKIARLRRAERLVLSKYYRDFEALWAELGQAPEGYVLLVSGVVPEQPMGVIDTTCIVHDLSVRLPTCVPDLGDWDAAAALERLRRIPDLETSLNRRMNGVRLQQLVVVQLSESAVRVVNVLGDVGAV